VDATDTRGHDAAAEKGPVRGEVRNSDTDEVVGGSEESTQLSDFFRVRQGCPEPLDGGCVLRLKIDIEEDSKPRPSAAGSIIAR
jgi:hypothetical protein